IPMMQRKVSERGRASPKSPHAEAARKQAVFERLGELFARLSAIATERDRMRARSKLLAHHGRKRKPDVSRETRREFLPPVGNCPNVVFSKNRRRVLHESVRKAARIAATILEGSALFWPAISNAVP